MLRRLTIRDFVLVDQLDLEFAPGFGVLTGETGAGKSILLDALSLLLGDRADSAMVRAGCERAEISGMFDCAPVGPVAAWLNENDLEADTEVLVRRVVDGGGRSRCYVNGSPVTAAQLKSLGELLADIHGQHAHHALLRGDAQRELLDTHAGATALAKEVSAAWRAWQAAVRALETAEAEGEATAREREMLEWQLSEARTLAFVQAEWQQTNADHQRLSHAAGLIEGAGAALDALDEGELAIATEVERLAARMAELARFDGHLTPVAELLDGAGIALGEAVAELRRYRDRMELDPEALAECERRIAAVTQFARKYRVAPEGIPALEAEWGERLALIERASDLDALALAESDARTAYHTLAAELSERRRVAAASLGSSVTEAMQDLAMAGGRFEIRLAEAPSGGAHGQEVVEFLVAANPHQEPRPLAKVASGGELSRIGLAIQVIASEAQAVPTLVFDEVDVGIGGRVAEVVGRRLSELGRRCQVLCVTHLPQVAARADWQWQISKESRDGATYSRVQVLDAAARIDEIARMLGGERITETTRTHAAEMLGFEATTG
ncbi:DNA repair protein RecN [Niveibacterium microcysteis]|uniref:DNA repair protein RecN n=1 Tax=Niveibacterium microcysteis TaxID=2811415 RepID=A0ABX7M0V2_9RHOO|nr:DNA repair protein RecN [Niveibacterium microcysteis]QSI75390.1 DNA repair protein RecN [Niveibacterium microcysteis]